MTSNIDTLVTVSGGSGFLGRHVVSALARRDYRIRVAVLRVAQDQACSDEPGAIGKGACVHRRRTIL